MCAHDRILHLLLFIRWAHALGPDGPEDLYEWVLAAEEEVQARLGQAAG